MSSSSPIIPRWVVVLAAQLVVGIVILNLYLRKMMDEKAVNTVTFERLGGSTDYQESKIEMASPGEATVRIRSSAGSGGYTMMVLDVTKNEGGHFTEDDVKKIPDISRSELQARLEQPVQKYGVTATRPTITHMEKRPGAAQMYEGSIKVAQPGRYNVVYVQLRPWQPSEHKIYYVVHLHAT